MQNLYDVHADHPIAKRIDEIGLTPVERNDLVAELKEANYENIKVTYKPHFEDGDEIEITSSMYESLTADQRDAKSIIHHILQRKAKLIGLPTPLFRHEIEGEEAMVYRFFPLKVTLRATREDRYMVYLQGEWEIGNGNTHTTNIYGLRNMGWFGFIEPESEEIPLMNANDDILYEHELVVKYYALQNEVSEEVAQGAIDKVQSAMSANGIVFYRP
jgi:hypothetical protein